jgi:hypothetical protein
MTVVGCLFDLFLIGVMFWMAVFLFSFVGSCTPAFKNSKEIIEAIKDNNVEEIVTKEETKAENGEMVTKKTITIKRRN